MKILFTSLIVFVTFIFTNSCLSNKSKEEMDSLKKYSYLISGDTVLSIGIGHAQGTGFFIKKNDKIYFVTAKHTLSGCGDNNIKEIRYPNTMSISLTNQPDNKIATISINTIPIKDTAPCLSFVLDPDIIAHPISDSDAEKYSFNFINDYIDKLPEKHTELMLWGFPKNGSNIFSFVTNKYTIERFKLTLLSGEFIKDSINYYITTADVKVDENLIGFSGSPIFLKDAVSGKYIFIGVLCATNNPENSLYVVKPEYLFDIIK